MQIDKSQYVAGRRAGHIHHKMVICTGISGLLSGRANRSGIKFLVVPALTRPGHFPTSQPIGTA